MTRGGLLLFVAAAILVLGTLGARPLYKADESRYAEISREMVRSGDWVTPRLNTYKYFEKPPMQYWATAAFFSAFGDKDWVARLWTALAGLGGIALTFFAGKRLFGRESAALGALVLAGCPLYLLLTQVNTLDMGVTLFLSGAVFAFALGRYYLFWAACALAVLSKGLIGIVLPGGAIGLYVLLRWDWGLLGKMRIPSGAALFLAIAAPWFIAVSAANHEFAHFFFIQEHFERFTTRMHGRYQPIWYFVPILAFGVAPWLVVLVPALRDALRARLVERRDFDAALFLALWIAVVFVFFSISSSKLPSYVLPLFPALALVIGRGLALAPSRRLLAAQAALAAAAGTALAAGAPALLGRLPGDSSPYSPVLAAAGLLLALGASAAAVAAWRGRQTNAVALLAAASFACTLVAMVGHQVISPSFSIARQAAGLVIPADARIFAVDCYDHTLPWYLGRPVTMVLYKDELGQPISWEPGKFIPDLPAFVRAWQQAPAAYAVFASEKFAAMSRELPVAMEVLSRGPRYTIVRKP